MIRNLIGLSSALALVLACGQGRTDGQNTGTTGGTGSETGAVPADTGYGGAGVDDTTASPSTDVADTAATTDSASVGDPSNQDQSGVTNTETGQSELGDSATQTTPDQGEPVTAKGDTVGTSGAGVTSDTAQ